MYLLFMYERVNLFIRVYHRSASLSLWRILKFADQNKVFMLHMLWCHILWQLIGWCDDVLSSSEDNNKWVNSRALPPAQPELQLTRHSDWSAERQWLRVSGQSVFCLCEKLWIYLTLNLETELLPHINPEQRRRLRRILTPKPKLTSRDDLVSRCRTSSSSEPEPEPEPVQNRLRTRTRSCWRDFIFHIHPVKMLLHLICLCYKYSLLEYSYVSYKNFI